MRPLPVALALALAATTGATAGRGAQAQPTSSSAVSSRLLLAIQVRENEVGLYEMTLPTKAVRPLVTDRYVFDAKYSPDGTKIAVSADWTGGAGGSNDPDIGVLPASGGTLTRLTTGLDTTDLDITWSPDSRSIAFTRSHPFAYLDGDIYRVDLTPSSPATLVAHAPTSPTGCTDHAYAAPRWHPYKPLLLIANLCARPGLREQRTSLLDTNTGKIVGTLPLNISGDWSPTGAHITGTASTRVTGTPLYGGAIVRVTAAGKFVNKVTPNASTTLSYGPAVWSPDGKRIAYGKWSTTGAYGIWSAPATGGAATKIADRIALLDWR